MSGRTDRFVARLVTTISRWDGVDTVGLVKSGDDRYDPYFFMSLDVYCTGDVPDAATRAGAFGEITAFESSTITRKDRFLVEDVPVRVEYKSTRRFDELTAAAHHGVPNFRDAGTYAFHRIQTAEIVFARTDWMQKLRTEIDELPDVFWDNLRLTQQALAEHTYADLSAAAVREDALYYSVSAGRFVSAVCALLFTINRKFEPSSRHLAEEVALLATVPDSFAANLGNFVREENQLSLGQRRELAELMVTRVLSL